MLSGYPGDTEVWTNNGWKKFLDIDLNEFVLPSVKQLEQHTDREIIIPEKHINLIDWVKFLAFG